MLLEPLMIVLLIVLSFIVGLVVSAYLIAKRRLTWEPEWAECTKAEFVLVKQYLDQLRGEE